LDGAGSVRGIRGGPTTESVAESEEEAADQDEAEEDGEQGGGAEREFAIRLRGQLG
jgi:hypothetical protein